MKKTVSSLVIFSLFLLSSMVKADRYKNFEDEHLVYGKNIWLENCEGCHGWGIADAPIPLNYPEWEYRIAKGKDVLYQHAIEGFFGVDDSMMPERGGNLELTDEEVMAAVDYMVELANSYKDEINDMSPEQIDLVKSTWLLVKPISEQAASIFYGKLFELDPELKMLFKGDMTEQGRKLMSMLNTAVNSLDNLESILPAVQDLGKRHVGYGVKDQHYETVGAALISTLEIGLEDKFTDEVKEAWTKTYTTLADVMIEAANEEEAA